MELKDKVPDASLSNAPQQAESAYIWRDEATELMLRADELWMQEVERMPRSGGLVIENGKSNWAT